MPKITLTWNQLYLLSDIVEDEADTERKYGCGDKSNLHKKCRLRDRIYDAIRTNGKEV